MSEQLTLELLDDLARQARALAAATNRRGLVMKARAWKEAVARGLKPRLASVL